MSRQTLHHDEQGLSRGFAMHAKFLMNLGSNQQVQEMLFLVDHFRRIH